MSRLILSWTRAAKAPSNMEPTEMKTRICCHCATRSPNGCIITRISKAMAAIFGATEKNAVTGVGAPS